MKRFFAGVLLAPLAGALAGFLAVMIGSLIAGTAPSERTLLGAAGSASFVGFWALLVCFAYTIVVGSAAYAYARWRGRRLSLGVALMVGILGAIPFGIASVAGRDITGEALMFPALALLCAIATAWTFWRVALAEANA